MTINIPLDLKSIWTGAKRWLPLLSVIYIASTQILNALCQAGLAKACGTAYSLQTMGNLLGVVNYADPAMVQGIASLPALAGGVYKLYLRNQAARQPAPIDPKSLIKQGPGFRGPQQ